MGFGISGVYLKQLVSVGSFSLEALEKILMSGNAARVQAIGEITSKEKMPPKAPEPLAKSPEAELPESPETIAEVQVADSPEPTNETESTDFELPGTPTNAVLEASPNLPPESAATATHTFADNNLKLDADALPLDAELPAEVSSEVVPVHDS
ncbi:MAG: hypothetical protein HC812_04815, partial [Leptolyngbya sp. RL_3_1]|nr:hypothetical protein [Leptolyngbya sp. RL_3_1]